MLVHFVICVSLFVTVHAQSTQTKKGNSLYEEDLSNLWIKVQEHDNILQALQHDGQGKGSCSCGASQPQDCDDIWHLGNTVSGVYTVFMRDSTNMGCCPFVAKTVYCDMDNGGPWLRILHRQDGLHDFPDQNWTQYESGFGDPHKSYWLGLKHMHQLTYNRQYKLRVQLEDWEGETRFAEYSYLRIDDWFNKYALHIGKYTGDAGDSLAHHNGQYFSTKDVDNDKSSSKCAVVYPGGWWFGKCYDSKLTGNYVFGGKSAVHQGIHWYHWRGHSYSYKVATMMIKQI